MFRKNISFPEAEEEVIRFWKENESFEESNRQSKDRAPFIFYDGPPFATGLPHYGHILSGTIKDTIGRFWYQQGFKVSRRFGWDCHGLPVEYEIDKKLNITDRRQILEMGIDKYNEECRSIVMKYSSEWESIVTRMGRWVDFKGGYRTMDRQFMESTWFIFKQLWTRNKIYRGYKVMPFSTACKTPLSNFEANQNYKDVSDPSVLVVFPLLKLFRGMEVGLIAWTTTPWTLPSNCGLIVNRSFRYDIFEHRGSYYAVHTDRVDSYFKDARIVDSCLGSDLVGLEYSQPFDFFENLRAKNFFRVISADFVSDSDGTGIVHCAPAFGEEDYRVFVLHGLIRENDEVPCPVDENGCFTLGRYKGIYVKDLDKIVLQDIKERVLMNNRIVHSYPFCWRSDTPLIYKLVPNWFVRVRESRDTLLKNNEMINWVPKDIKYRRFHNWLAQARDWAVSRNRFWGTPLPLWTTENYEDVICIGSVSELESLSGQKVEDIHRQHIDDITISRNGKTYRRVDEVLDCWFESGSMPFSQDHWPFCLGDGVTKICLGDTSQPLTKDGFPSQFIGEGLDQTRGWFYTLHVISSLLFDSPAFENVIVNGIVLAEDGKKMSKRLKNYPDPSEIFSKYGGDALRMYLISSPVVEAENLRFNETGVREIMKVLLIPWYNSLSFLMECKRADQATGMDDWIVASFNNFCFSVTTSVKSYRLSGVLDYALKFIDDLSNWYIRINRKAIRSGANLLAKLLEDFSIVMAPFTPFFSEYCYRSISTSGSSVHHCMYPVATLSSHPFEKAKNVIESIRQMREKLKLKVKRPVKSVTIVCSDSLRDTLTSFVDVIEGECNILDVLFENESKFAFRTTARPFFESLKSDRSTMKAKIDAIRSLSDSQIAEVIGGYVEANGIKIKKEDVILTREFVGVMNSETFGEFGLVVDDEINDEIAELADAREFYSFVQKLRKSSGLSANDRACVGISNSYIKDIVSKKYPDVAFGDEGIKVAESSYLLDGKPAPVDLYRLD